MTLPIVFEQILSAPISVVWKAITDKEIMKKWYFDFSEFQPKVGFEFQFTGGTEENTYLHLCKITEVIENKKLTYSWRYDGFEGNSFVTFDLFNEGDFTRLILTHAGLDSFPQIKDFARENFEAGWTEIIGKSLKEFVETHNLA